MPQLIYLQSTESPDDLVHFINDSPPAHPALSIPEGLTVPEVCLRINEKVGREPVLMIAGGIRCLDLPAIARAQAAAHRPIIGYALISPDFPVSTDQWPNAPVTVYLPKNQDPEKSMSLRGYRIVHFEGGEMLSGLIFDQSQTAQ